MVGTSSVHCKILSSLSGLYPPDASITLLPKGWIPKISLYLVECPCGGGGGVCVQNSLLPVRNIGLKVTPIKKDWKKSIRKIPNSGIWVTIILVVTCAKFTLDLVFLHIHTPICLPLEPKALIALFVTKLILRWIHVKINKVERHVPEYEGGLDEKFKVYHKQIWHWNNYSKYYDFLDIAYLF